MEDTITDTAAAEAAATEQGQEIPSAEESSNAKTPKTYTEAEVDTIVKGRIDKARAKHEAEVEDMRKQLDELKAENDAFKAAEAVAEARRAVADEMGVDASLLDGETEAEIRAQARVLSKAPKFPTFRDSGEKKVAAPTKESILAIQNERERLAAIREHAELFQ